MRPGAWALLVVLGCGLAHAADQDDALYASYACQQYALAALKTLGKPRVDAAGPATPANDPRWAGQANVWHAAGTLQAQARFGGAMVGSAYRCTVKKAGAGGWTLLDLQWPQGRP